MNLSTLLREHARMKPPLIGGLLRQSEIGSLSGPSKARKSWLMLDLAIAVATGQPWLGKYETQRGRVLITDFELYPEVLCDRLPQIAAARGVSMRDLDGQIEVECFRGKNRDLYQLAPFFDKINPGDYALCIVDPLYRTIPSGISENDNAQIARLFSQLDAFAANTGAAFICAHHTTKSSQAGQPVTSVGAGAGSFARAVDTHIILRQHEEADCFVMEAALRSFPPVAPSCYKWEHPIWKEAPTLDPAKLRDDSPNAWRRRPRKDKPLKRTAKEEFAVVMGLVENKWREQDDLLFDAAASNVSERHALRALKAAAGRGIIEKSKDGTTTIFRKAKRASEQPTS